MYNPCTFRKHEPRLASRQPASHHPYANDGNVGVVLTMDKAPPDPTDKSRRFTNEYLHQWMPPLGDGH